MSSGWDHTDQRLLVDPAITAAHLETAIETFLEEEDSYDLANHLVSIKEAAVTWETRPKHAISPLTSLHKLVMRLTKLAKNTMLPRLFLNIALHSLHRKHTLFKANRSLQSQVDEASKQLRQLMSNLRGLAKRPLNRKAAMRVVLFCRVHHTPARNICFVFPVGPEIITTPGYHKFTRIS